MIIDGIDTVKAYGPNHATVVALLSRVKHMQASEVAEVAVNIKDLASYLSAQERVLDGQYDKKYGAAIRGAFHITFDHDNDFTESAIIAVAIKDEIAEEDYRLLTDPVVHVIGSSYFE